VAAERPADALDAIVGQEAAVALLRRALASGKVGHAYAFAGPPGSGRRRAALAFAAELVAPGDARQRERIARGAHLDVRVLEPTPPEGNPKGPLGIRIADIRDLERLASLRPVEAPVKVFVIDEAQRMTLATPQAFLKTLEEPPARTVLILILPHARALPATVLSRCQLVRFAPPAAPGQPALLPRADDAARAPALAWLAGGREDHPALAEAVGRDRGRAEAAVETCWLWYRDVLCRQAGGGAPPALPAHAAGVAADAAALSPDAVLAALGACREAWLALAGNVGPALTLEVLMGRLGPRPRPAEAAA
jgi:DNA polymerase-3 subunit delta'